MSVFKSPMVTASTIASHSHDNENGLALENRNNDDLEYHHHECIVLFYQYFLPSSSDNDDDDESCSSYQFFLQHSDHYMPKICTFMEQTCCQLNMKGRILLSYEGVNGTLSAENQNVMNQFIHTMEELNIMTQFNLPPNITATTTNLSLYLFTNIDWKFSSTTKTMTMNDPFPDLKIRLVKEIVSSGGAVHVSELPKHGGTHLSPTEFHNRLSQHWSSSEKKNDNVVVIDVRNPYEYDVGHFQSTDGNHVAINPDMNTFATFDSHYCAKHADSYKDKEVFMYCTGGIRCEKASAMLKKRGVANVYQLSGGIHRYIEQYGHHGFFRGKNFVFDQRVTQDPSTIHPSTNTAIANNDDDESTNVNTTTTATEVVGKCVLCHVSYDEYSGARICTVCRELVLICPKCESTVYEIHCPRHVKWKDCYFTFLESFTINELQQQKLQLENILQQTTTTTTKNTRHTINKQINKIQQRIHTLHNKSSTTTTMLPSIRKKYCRYCFQEKPTICNGLCWGYWKQTSSESQEPIKHIAIGDLVQPGKDWNIHRLGNPNKYICGTVIELKTWGSNNNCKEYDCVTVQWDDDNELQIYQWGTIQNNGKRHYDLQRIE